MKSSTVDTLCILLSLSNSAYTATCATPTLSYSSFSYTQVTSNRYATSLSAPLTFATPFAPPFSDVSGLLPTNAKTTTYSLNRNAMTSHDGKYGQSAYAALWASYSYTDAPPFTTTVSPAPVARTELIYPPALYTACPAKVDACLDCYKLPADFIWGVAGSAWQIEGGLMVEGRGPSSLDFFGNLDSFDPAANDSNVSDMNYFLYKQDIARLAAIGAPYYSFSISWSRIVPFGVAGSPVNQQGLDHYDDVIDTCLQYGIKPIVILNHDDAPTTVDLDNADQFSAAFLFYAKQVMTRYGDRVPYWVTFNEPNIQLGLSFRTYNALTNILMTHAGIYRWYKKTLGGSGKITIKFSNNAAMPLDPANTADISAALRYQDFLVGIMGTPLFLGKQYPSDVLNTPGVNLTALTPSQIAHIHGSIDFFSVDPYVAQFASAPAGGIAACASDASNPLWPQCAVLSNVQSNGWLMGDESNDYAYIAPQYVRQQLGYIWNTFKPSGILISEFGFNPYGEASRTLNAQRYDLERTLYYQDFLREVLKAIYEDGINVIGTLAWSFIDNNEFGSFTNQYGLQHVNRTSGMFERTYKRSFFDFVDFFNTFVARD